MTPNVEQTLDALQRELAEQKLALQRKQAELERVSQELAESHRGILNLYAELDEKADSLRRSAEVKSRVVANVSHEFRTPLNSILGLARLLLTRADGPLNAEQEKQLGFILKSADELTMMVNDVLELSKIEAGKIRLTANDFTVATLFGALRGMLRPLERNPAVELVIEDPEPLPGLHTDEGKVSQIVRNLVANALKFTERGEVRVRAFPLADDRIAIAVKDTGIGIARDDQERIFEEFIQLDSPTQRRVKGTGLGLSLSRKLAELLGGTLTVESVVGQGSTFQLTMPIVHPEVTEMNLLVDRAKSGVLPGHAPVLVVEDDRQTMFLYEKYLQGSGFQVMPARSIEEARAVLRRTRPCAIVLDVMLEGESSWRFLSELKESPETREIPTLVVTVTDREQKARALGADEFFLKPMDQQWLVKKLRTLARVAPVQNVLVIDDDEISRYLVRRMLADTHYGVIEAESGQLGVKLAREQQPQVILLDFVMPGMSAFEVLDELKADPRTRSIPVIIHTSKTLDGAERQRLQAATAAILNKQSLSREIAIARIRDALTQAVNHAGKEHPHG